MPALIQQLDELGQLARRWAMSRACCWAVSVLLLLGLVLIGCDAIFELHDPVLRWFISLTWWGVGLASVVYSWQYWKHSQTSPLAVAARLERFFPSLRDRLTSSVEFLQVAPQARVESSTLRERVVLETVAELDGLELQQALDRQPLRRSLGVMATLAAIVVLCCLAQPALAMTGISRLLNPLSTAEWPRTHVLHVDSKQARVTRGQSWHAMVTNQQGDLPRDVTLWFRSRDARGQWVTEQQLLPWRADRIAIHRDQVRQSFEYRVTGGDDQHQAWQAVEVVAAAELSDLQLTVQAPAYTGWPKYPAKQPWQCLADSQLHITGTATTSLESVTLQAKDKQLQLVVDATDRRRFRTPTNQPWQITGTEPATLKLISVNGDVTEFAEPIEFKILPDQRPSWKSESWDTAETYTVKALLPIQGWASDDVGLKSVHAEFKLIDSDQPPIQQMLWQEQNTTRQFAESELQELAKGRWPNERLTINQTWDLSRLKLNAGEKWQLTVIVTDSHDQKTVGATRYVTIVSEVELTSRLEQRLGAIQTELMELLRQQKNLLQELSAAKAVTNVTTEQLRAWSTWSNREQQILQAISHDEQGIITKLERIAQTLQANQIGTTDWTTQLQTMLSTLRQLSKTPGQELLAKFDELTNQLSPKNQAISINQLRPVLQTIITAQQVMIDELTKLVGELGQTKQLVQLERELTELIEQQRRLQQQSAQLLPATLGRQFSELSEAQQRDLAEQAQSQQALLADWEKWKSMLQRSQQNDERTSQRVQQLQKLILQYEPGPLMSAAARELADNRLGQATTNQLQAIERLEKLLPITRKSTGSSQTNSESKANTNDNNPQTKNENPEQTAISELLQAVNQALIQQTNLKQLLEQWQQRHGDQLAPASTEAQHEFQKLRTDQQQLGQTIASWDTLLPAQPGLRRHWQRLQIPLEQAVQRLQQGQADSETTTAQQAVMNGLQLLQFALDARTNPTPEQEKPDPKTNNQQTQEQAPTARLTPWQVAELKLLTGLQLELNARTTEIRQRLAKLTEPSAAEQKLAAQVAAEQEQLRILLLRIMPVIEAAEEPR